MRILSISIAVLFLVGGVLVATPALAADPLNWEPKVDAPSGVPGVYQLLPGSDILDFDFDSSGMTMYAATGNGLYKSTDGGVNTSEISSRLPTGNSALSSIDYVAMAPDAPDIVVVASATPNANNHAAAISGDGGATWLPMGVIQNSSGTSHPTAILGLKISPLSTADFRYIAVYGYDDEGTASGAGAALYYYNHGAGIGAWKEAKADFNNSPAGDTTIDNIVAMAFSPGFHADYMAVALSEQIGGGSETGALRLHILSFNSCYWDTDVASGYPVTLSDTASPATAFNVNSASIALHPDYDGGDEALRIAFVGVSITSPAGTESGGIWRCRDSASAYSLLGGSETTGVGIHSVAFDGTNLAAGAYWSNNVYRCAAAMAPSPEVLPAQSYKKIGIDQISGYPDPFADNVTLMFVGETLYGAKGGAASALSRSVDYGNTWNDYTLMDSGSGPPFFNAGTVTDILITATGDPWYMAAHDGNETSIYRISMASVQKVLCVDGVYHLMLRGVDSNPDVVYAADKGGYDLYYTDDGGLLRWHRRTTPAHIVDMAVESDDVVYIGEQYGISIFKSITNGLEWSLPIDSNLGSGNNINSLLSIGENELLVGGTLSGLNYTRDGGSTWTKTMGIFPPRGPVQPAATGLDTGDFIFLADEFTNDVFRCEIGPANTNGEFESMNMPSATLNETNTGIVLKDGVLYALSVDPSARSYINRTMTPTIPGTHSAPFWGTRYMPEPGVGLFDLKPSALKASSGPDSSIVLYAIDSNFNFVYYFDDTLALNGPELVNPVDGALFQKDQLVNMLWNRLSKATAYEVALALDDDFNSILNIDDAAGTGNGINPYCKVPGTFDVMSLILDNSYVPPNNTFYWKVRTYMPLVSQWSEVRSFTIEPAAAEAGTTVRVNAPAWAPNGYDFTVPVNINGVHNLDAASYYITFDPAVLALNDVTGGDIAGMSIPVDTWNEDIPGTVSIAQNLAGTSGVSGSGHLAVLHFTAIGSPVDSTELDIHDGVLSDNAALEITATWIDDLIYISDFIMGDANGDGKVNALDITAVELIIVGLPLP
jgi:hypothetical protein